MPSSVVMEEYRAGKLHSGKKAKGKKRKIVKNPKQAKGILLSYLRNEGRIGPRKKSKKSSHKRVEEKKG
jgi:hypothetical protein